MTVHFHHSRRRFRTDRLDGDAYFKTKRAGPNLDRARNQFTLVRSLERQQAVREAIVKKPLLSCVH